MDRVWLLGSTVNFRDSMGTWPHHSPHHQLKSTWTDTPGSWHMFERIAPIHQAPGATGALQGSVEVLDWFIELDDGKIYRKALYLMVKTMVSCRFSLKPIHWLMFFFCIEHEMNSEFIRGNSWKFSMEIKCFMRISHRSWGKNPGVYSAPQRCAAMKIPWLYFRKGSTFMVDLPHLCTRLLEGMKWKLKLYFGYRITGFFNRLSQFNCRFFKLSK